MGYSSLCAACLALGLLFACQSSKESEGKPKANAERTAGQAAKKPGTGAKAQPASGPVAKRPWSKTFMTKGVLVADEVKIIGPEGLYEHLVVKQEPDFHVHTLRTTSEGLQTEIVPKEGVEGVEIRVYLDNLNIAAMRRVYVLERPGVTALVLEASGQAMLQMEGQPQQRSSLLRLVGDPPQ